MLFPAIREKVNLLIYDSKSKVIPVLKVSSVLISASVILSLIYYYGFPKTDFSNKLMIYIVRASFAFYIFHFIIRIIYDFKPREFFKKNWIEAIIMTLISVEGISDLFFNKLIIQDLFINIGFDNFAEYSILFTQLYLMIVMGVRLFENSGLITNIKLHPANIFIFSFIALIGSGTTLLMLPEMTTIEGSMNFLDALFTSSSATCVTGLIVEDTPTFFTFKGQLVLLILMKLGGLNIIAFGTFLAIITKLGFGVKHHSVIEDFVNKDSVFGSNMFRNIIIWSCAIELLGSTLIFLLFNPEIPFKGVGDKIFTAIFHSVSAFNNAGFSLFTDGMFNDYVRYNYLVHLVIIVLIFFGSIGFITIFDLFSIKQLRNRMKYPWKQISFSSKISLYFSIALLAIGTVVFYFAEQKNSLKDQSIIEGLITSLFQSSQRTAGFNTVDFSQLTAPAIIILLVLMFIGSSSSSTGGGIKTSTLAVIWASVIATMRGKENTELFKRNISYDLISKAFAVLVIFLIANLIGIFVLSITETKILQMENRGIVDLIFEHVSAMGTVGLSTGITSSLSSAGKVTIIIAMFIGRAGTLTIAYAFSKSAMSNNYKYPEGHTMIA